MAAATGVPVVVTNDVLIHVPERRILQDVVTCVRHNITIEMPVSAANVMPTWCQDRSRGEHERRYGSESLPSAPFRSTTSIWKRGRTALI